MKLIRIVIPAVLSGAILLVAAACDEGVTPTIAPPLTVTPIPTSSATASGTATSTETGTPSATETSTGTETATATASETGSPGPGGPIEVDTGDNFYDGPGVQGGGTPGQAATIDAKAGSIQIHVKNDGAAIHNLHITGIEKTTAPLTAGSDETLDLGDVAPGQYSFMCDFHPTEMLGTLVVS